MAKYVFAYHGGGKPETEAEGKALMERWMNWFGSMGAAVIDEGNPVGQSYMVAKDNVADNGGANPISGYSLIEAESIEAAIEMAKGCPMVQDGTGNVEIAEAMVM